MASIQPFMLDRLPVSWADVSDEAARACVDALERTRAQQIAAPPQPAAQTPPMTLTPQEIYLNSSDGYRSTAYHSDATFQFPRSILCPEGYSMYVSLSSLSMANTMLVVSPYTHSLLLNGNEYLIPDGNYSAASLVAALRGVVPATFSASYDATTLKATIASSAPFTIDGTALELLGMTPAVGVTSVTSDNTVNLRGVQAVYVLTSLPGDSIDMRAGGSGYSTLARVPLDAEPLKVLHYENTGGTAGVLVHDSSIMCLRVLLEDEMRRPLLCTLPWDACLSVKFVWMGRRALGTHPRPTSLAAAF
ncbi:hypothetical protein JKP88DRAFT_289980 [Tribonema minus]|uniref:Uncharacterized protein n=1 Tax=Tribonema minus TaxID=303371 RepID=A0A835Z8K3_9STRA|nr:hypothetical protein JKP88DRAFT_289980 [Tribonema minus]